MFNGLRLPIVLLICVGAVGCQQASDVEVVQQTGEQSQTISIELKPLMAPLSDHEVTAFLRIVERLPQGTVPEFSPLQHAPQPQAKSVQEHVGQLQQRFRDSIDARKQAELWNQDSKLRNAFKQMQVDPVAFSALAARISFAWSALAIGEKLPVATTERTLTSHLYQLMQMAQSPPKGMTQHQREQMLSALEETVALGEFLQLLKKVPAESVTKIASFRDELDHLLPRTNPVAAFEKHLVKEPEIIRVGHSQ